MIMDVRRIEDVLSALVGLPLFASNRAGDIQTFSFGAERELLSRFGPKRGTVRKVGEFALHVQCAWTITDGARTIARADELASPMMNPTDVHPDRLTRNPTLRDEHIGQWLASGEHLVASTSFRSPASVVVRFANLHELAVTPEQSDSGEYWRLFRPGLPDPHLVVSSQGARFE